MTSATNMTSEQTSAWAALLLRLALGAVYLSHGLLKVFVFTVPGTVGFFRQVGYPGWLAYLVILYEVIGGRGRLVGVDFDAPQGIDGIFIEGSALEIGPEVLGEALGGAADVLLSDMAPNTTGDRFADHVRQLALADRALDCAIALLRPGGHFVTKVFEGASAPAYVERVRAHFEAVRRIKPKATRDRSVEFFVIGLRATGS